MQPLDQSDPLYKHKRDSGPVSLPVYFLKIGNLWIKKTDELTPESLTEKSQGIYVWQNLAQNGISLLSISLGPLL